MSNMLYTLGASLARIIGKDETLCRGLLRMAVIHSVEQLRQLTDPAHVTTETVAYMEKMTYQDWKTIIEGPVLTKTLANIGVKDASATKAKLMQVLVEQQSLFTMTAH